MFKKMTDEIVSQVTRDEEELCSYSLRSELPSVLASGCLKNMSKKEIEFQERWFEILRLLI